jgi:hypothetical protein
MLTAGSGAGLTLEGTQSWVQTGAETEFSGGSVGAVTFGDPSEPLTVEWRGFEGGETEVVFNVTVRGLAGGENAGTWSNGEEETEAAVLAQGTHTVEGGSGAVELSWTEIFGEERPVTVSDHPDIRTSDFEANGTDVRSRMLVVGVEAMAPEQDATAEDSTMLGAVLGVEPLGYVSEPPTDSGSTQMAVVVHNPSGGGGDDEPEPALEPGEPEPETEPEPVPAPPGGGGGGGGGIITPVPVPEDREAEASGVGSFEAVSEHGAVEDE